MIPFVAVAVAARRRRRALVEGGQQERFVVVGDLIVDDIQEKDRHASSTGRKTILQIVALFSESSIGHSFLPLDSARLHCSKL
jgi:hypothetical protein